MGPDWWDVSFAPDGTWFVFDNVGATVQAGFKSKDAACAWANANVRR